MTGHTAAADSLLRGLPVLDGDHCIAVAHSAPFDLLEVAVPAPLGDVCPERILFPWASVTKSLTGALLAMAELRGLMDLQAPLREYAPGFGDLDALPVWRIATHTADLPEDLAFAMDEEEGTPDPDQLQHALSSVTLDPANRQWSYSNVGYAILAHTLSQVTHRSWLSLVRAWLAGPLGMTNICLSDGGPPPGTAMAPGENVRVHAAAGGCWATTTDTATWASFLARQASVPGYSRLRDVMDHFTASVSAKTVYGLGAFPYGTQGVESWGTLPGSAAVINADHGHWSFVLATGLGPQQARRHARLLLDRAHMMTRALP